MDSDRQRVALRRRHPKWLRLYIDSGSPAQTADDANAIPAAVVPLSIGSAEAFSFPGQIDEVQLFNRALPASEISSIFNAGSVGVCKN